MAAKRKQTRPKPAPKAPPKPPFAPGDVGVLKSGGRKMTIENVQTDGIAQIVWFDERMVFCRSSAHIGTFDKVTEA